MKRKKRKRAQHEAIGFVMIVVILVIIALIFVSFSLRKKEYIEKTDEVMSDFCYAMLSYTLSCNSESHSIRELIRKCANMEDCGGENSCEKAYTAIQNIVKEESKIWDIKGYELSIVDGEGKVLECYGGGCYSDGQSSKFYISDGSLQGSYTVARVPIAIYGGNFVELVLKVYLGEEQ